MFSFAKGETEYNPLFATYRIRSQVKSHVFLRTTKELLEFSLSNNLIISENM